MSISHTLRVANNNGASSRYMNWADTDNSGPRYLTPTTYLLNQRRLVKKLSINLGKNAGLILDT